jgi:dephospho-CoA kinase
MIRNVGITGNIGSGKSTVAHLFELMGIPIYIADREARKFFLDQAVIQDITKIAGNRILDEQQQIDRRILAEILFSNPELLSAVNHIIHPRVMKDYLQWSKMQNQAPFTLFESAIIFEHGLETNFDKIINVDCPEEIAIMRAAKRDHQTEEQIKSRLAHQMSSKIKNQKADFVIYTDDRHSVINQVLSIFMELSTK